MLGEDHRDRHRVVITGMGVVTSIGVGVREFADGLRDGRSGAKPITAFPTEGYEHSVGTEVVGFDAAAWLRRLDPARVGRAGQFSAAAARMAIADAGLSDADVRGQRSLVSVGTTDGESRDLDELTVQMWEQGPERLDPRLARRMSAARVAGSVVGELGLHDVEAVTIPTACAAGNYAIGYGLDALRSGDVEIALAGGVDTLCRKTFAGFYRLGAMAPAVCSPFDLDREGILTGEGAGILVLETLESATARSARIYAEVLGYGLTCDALSPVAPDEASLARCMSIAHEDAGVQAADVDFISAHGTGTRANDSTEAEAIRKAFGTPPPTVSIKGMLGHTMGAASALATAACALAITEEFIPPTINHRTDDPACGLDCVPNRARAARVDVVQNDSLAFGGNNAVLILGRHGRAA